MNRDILKPSKSSLPSAAQNVPASRLRVDVAVLMDGGRDVVLVLAGQEYLLRITQQGKLILTK